MAQLEILEYPDPRLRQRAEPVEAVDESIRALARDMLETMYAAPGIGLAAIQVNVPKRVIVVDVSEDGSEPLVLVYYLETNIALNQSVPLEVGLAFVELVD